MGDFHGGGGIDGRSSALSYGCRCSHDHATEPHRFSRDRALVSDSHWQLRPLEGTLSRFAGFGKGHNLLVSLGVQSDGSAKTLFDIEAGLVVDLHHIALGVFEVNAMGNTMGD